MALLDKTDKRLLHLLQEDSTRTIKQIAAELNLTSTPVYERIKRLEKTGIITRYRAEIDPDKVGKKLLVFSHVSLKEHAREYLLNFEGKVRALEEVTECYHVSGEHDYFLKILANDMDDYRDFITNKLSKIANIGNVTSSFVMGHVKKDRIIHLD